MHKEYKVMVVPMSAGAGQGNVAAAQVTTLLNSLAAEGWEVKFCHAIGYTADAVPLFILLERSVE